MLDYQIAGLTDFLLSDPPPELIRSRGDVDTLNESWQASRIDAFVENQVHPDHPGMIIDSVRAREEAPGLAYVLAITALGSYDGRNATKYLSRQTKKTLDGAWQEEQIEALTWLANWRPCTGNNSAKTIYCADHGLPNNQRVKFRNLTGGSGIVPLSSTSLGTAYYVVNATPHAFQLTATLGGAVMALGSDLTAGFVIAEEFCPGAVHPDYPFMILHDVDLTDAYTSWRRARCNYRGYREPRPAKRIIAVNGQEVSAESMTVPTATFPGGGWNDATKGQAQMPRLTVTDIEIRTTAPDFAIVPTSDVLDASGEVAGGRVIPADAVIPNPPNVNPIWEAITGTALRWPNHWALVNMANVDTIPGTTISLLARTWEYIPRIAV